MPVLLQAPLPGIETTTVLPDPVFNDSQARRHSLNIQRAMDGTRYSYVKSNNRSKLNYAFTLTRMKALELRAFVQAYFRAQVRLTNHKDEVWEGYLISNPFEFEGSAKAGGWAGGEAVSITLEFEAVRA